VLVLDTDLMSIIQLGPPAERARLLDWLRGAADQNVVVTIVTFEEHVRGWMAVIARAKTPQQQVPAYERLRAMLESYRPASLLDFGSAAADRFIELRRRHRRQGTADLKIAAITLTAGATLLTRNVRDFADIEGLVVENPLAR
jgi:tRNA(fMet)-specific endonuclease VapC